MNFIGKVLLFCLLMGLLQKAVEVLLVGLALAWIYGAIIRPVETFGLLFLLTVTSCIRAHPGWALISIVILIVIVCIGNAKAEDAGQ